MKPEINFSFLIGAAVGLLSPINRAVAAEPIAVLSPDRAVQLRILVRDTELSYEVKFRNNPVVETSPLAISVDGVDLTAGIDVGQLKRYAVQESYPWRGVHSAATNHCNGGRMSRNSAHQNSQCKRAAKTETGPRARL